MLELLGRLRRLDVRLVVDGDRLTLSAPDGVVTDQLRAEIAARKVEVLAFLRDQQGREETGLVLERAKRGQPAPLSFAQQRLWFLHQLHPDDPVYNIGSSIEIDGALPDVVVAEGLRILAGRHEMLRTVFRTDSGIPTQIATDQLPGLRTEVVDLSAEEARRGEVARLSREAIAAPFRLEEAPGFRAVLIRIPGGASHLLMIVHHILADGWSLGLMVQEFREIVDGLRRGRVPTGDPNRWQYADYAYSQARWFGRSSQPGHANYWRQKLAGCAHSLDLPTDRPRERVLGNRGDSRTFTLSSAVAERVRSLSQDLGGTPFTTLLAVFKVFLHRYSGRSDILLGTPASNRTLAELESVVGFFISTMVLRTDLSGDPSFRECEARVRLTMLEAHQHRDFPFEKVVEIARPDRSLAHSPLFQTAFVFNNAPLTGTYTALGSGAVYELSIYLWDSGAEIHGSFEFNADLYQPETINRMIEHFVRLVGAVVTEPDIPISRLAMVGPEEQLRLVDEWNQTATSYPRDASVVELFERQADSAPDAVAIVGADGSGKTLTYRQLDQQANRLAGWLTQEGVGPESTVGVVLNRSADYVVAILAILKAGATYVPIDARLPADRRALLIHEAGIRFVIGGDLGRPALSDPAVTGFDLATAGPRLARQSADRLGRLSSPLAPAYVMFTSGSTGIPKAVVVPHRAIVRLVRQTSYLQLTRDDVILAAAPVSFDASTFEIWGSLLNGGRLILYPGDPPEPRELARLLKRHRVTTLWLTAGLFHLVVDSVPEALTGLRHLLAGGDVLSPAHVRRALAALGGGTLINGYGPTENTTFTCCHRMTVEADVDDPVRIGRPISNTRVYLLDQAMEPVPTGVRGELWTGGDGLALGYLNDPALTAERFRPDPFSSEPGARMYRTGDLARYRADGVLEFLGRVDNQIKIRGFRIEPGEVEAALRRHPGVTAAVVTARPSPTGERQLIGYVVVEGSAPVAPENVLTSLRRSLPEYAVPTHCLVVPAIPLTANGKVDLDALPPPAEPALSTSVAFAPDGLETQLLAIWEKVLAVSGIGLRDNFFDLGGSSLLGIRLLADLERLLGRRVPASVLYQGQTVETMANTLRQDLGDVSFRAIAIQPGGSRPPLFVVPGINGNVIGYQGLARALGQDQPLYGLRSVGLDGEAPPLETIEAIAAAIVPEIQRVQPRGPYQLLGFCMGGIVAYEVAQQLRAAGESVGLIALLDSWAPELIPDRAKVTRRGQQLRFVAVKALRYSLALWHLPWRQRWRFLREKATVLNEVVAQRDLYRGDRFLLFRQLVTAANQRAAARYRPRPYPGGVALIVSTERPVGTEGDPRLTWAGLATGESRVLRVDAMDSGSVLRSPHVEQLAESLAGLLAGGTPPVSVAPVANLVGAGGGRGPGQDQ